jgi:hypothetical protein
VPRDEIVLNPDECAKGEQDAGFRRPIEAERRDRNRQGSGHEADQSVHRHGDTSRSGLPGCVLVIVPDGGQRRLRLGCSRWSVPLPNFSDRELEPSDQLVIVPLPNFCV